VVLEQFPKRLVPKLVKLTLADMMRKSAQGKKSVSQQTYMVRNAVAAGDWVALQVDWEGVLAVPVASLQAGAAMRAYFAMFLTSAVARSCTRAITTASNRGKGVKVVMSI
jgi:hypothetical protein